VTQRSLTPQWAGSTFSHQTKQASRNPPTTISIAKWATKGGTRRHMMRSPFARPVSAAIHPRTSKWIHSGVASTVRIGLAAGPAAAGPHWSFSFSASRWRSRARLGAWIHAAGANPEAARYSGVPVGAVTVSAYVVCAVCAMVAGLLLSGYLGYVDQNLGLNGNLNSIVTAIIGGVAFSGGRGGVMGATIGAVLLTVLVNLVVVAGLAVYWQLIATGLVLVLAVTIQGLRDRWMPDT